MWSDRRTERSSEDSAIGLTLAELIAVQPRHCRQPKGAGLRPAIGERVGRGWARSFDFDGVSPYQTGDDVRRIHWRATARSSRVQMRRFAAPSHRARMVVVDLSPALCFGTKTRPMAKTAALVAARLSWETLANQEPVGLAIGGQPILEPHRGKRHVLRLLDHLRQSYDAACQGEPGTPPSLLVKQASPLLGHGDDLCLVSDFADLDADFERWSAALAEIRALRALVVEDPLFRSEVPSGRYPMRDESNSATAVLKPGDPSSPLMTIEELRQEQKRRLENCGWNVEDALDLLPQGYGS